MLEELVLDKLSPIVWLYFLVWLGLYVFGLQFSIILYFDAQWFLLKHQVLIFDQNYILLHMPKQINE